MSKLKLRLMFVLTTCLALGASAASAERPGILLLAHGGSPEWNARVIEMARQIERTQPTEVAFGMATRANIQSAIDRLTARGVTEIIAVPLFISSWSSVITSTEYLLGKRAEAPSALAVFAQMNHSAGAHSELTDEGAHNGHSPADGTSPVLSPVPIRMTPALNDHPIVADILTTRAQSISRDPAMEAVIIVAHGPNGEDENRRWLVDMATLARYVTRSGRFASVDYLTLRDDAPKPVRDAATAALRQVVEQRTTEGKRVLVVPLLLSFGGIERGLRERLEGLSYTMPQAGLMPDPRLVTWVLEMAGTR